MIAELVAALCLCTGPATGPYEPAERGEQVQVYPLPAPPPPEPPQIPNLWNSSSANGRCVGSEFLLGHFSPGWDVVRMSRIMYRESRCLPHASNSCCSGLLQMHRMHVPIESCGVYSRNDFYDPAKNICAAADLWRSSGYGAWTTS